MTCFADPLEVDMMQAEVEAGEPLSVDECRHLLAEVRRLQAKEGRGRLLVPLLEWETRMMDHTVRVTMCLPEEEFRRMIREALIEQIDRMAEQVKHTYLRAWETMQP